MTSNESWLRLNNLSKAYETVKALDSISLESNAKVLGLVGPNGAGKTTLIKILLGLLQPNSGDAYLFNSHTWKKTTGKGPKIGVMLEQDIFPHNHTVYDYLEFVCDIYNVLPTERKLDVWCNRLDLPMNRQIAALSAGMRRKLSLLRAIVPETDLIILDEPTANIDPLGREKILDLILDLKQKRKTKILISSHLLFDLERIAEEILILNRGKLVEQGSTLRIIQDYCY